MRTVLLLVLFGIAAFAQPKSPAVLLASGGGEGAWRLRQALVNSEGFDVRITEETAELTASTLAHYDAVLVDCGSRSWRPAALQSIRAFVEAGKGLAVVRRPDALLPLISCLGQISKLLRSEKAGSFKRRLLPVLKIRKISA